ncbi:MAG TPA: ribosome silencing factor [Hydrogenophaga sp.]|uniref:ribosome silencing factor n=1 Tax=Hydrogenophaga sp. TaxID=1904254 RepID=UPI002CB401B2|nr:ribosome silencing factor [Hydrogenophaga sp.]HMN92413.1 ribosome silencing factor [Hydrogenophaga sp.]HMP10185.1 ribosome silencing factor [Hydrogenophaga sp.]
MTSESTSKKQLQRLQRAIVDGLEDVKGQDIVVFNTEELSPLFERVIVASGTSNRQTKALAASVRDKVREAGFDKPRIEGEDNGEWIIVDCGQAVAHVMQPVIRQYYRLEEIWGAKPVRVRHGTAKPTSAPAPAARKKALTAPAADRSPTGKAAAAPRTGARSARSAPVAVAAQPAPARKKAPARTSTRQAASSAAGKTRSSGGATAAKSKAALPKLVVNKPRPAAKPTAAKPAVTKSGAAKTAARKSAANKKVS